MEVGVWLVIDLCTGGLLRIYYGFVVDKDSYFELWILKELKAVHTQI